MFLGSPLAAYTKLHDARVRYLPDKLSHFPKLVHHQNAYLEFLDLLLATTENPLLKSQNELTEISKELSALKREKIVELSRRLQLSNNSYELRLLRNHLRTAVIANEMVEQKRDNDQIIKDDIKRKEKEMADWLLIYQQAKESLAREQEEQRQNKLKLTSALKAQMAELQQRRNEKKLANLKEGEELQRKLKAMKLEDQAMRERSHKIHLKLQQEMQENIQERTERKRLNKIEDMNHIEQSRIYQKEKDELNAKMVEERRRIRQERQSLSERMGYVLLRKRKADEDRFEQLMDLLVEERNTKENEAAHKRRVRDNEERLALRHDFELYHNVIKPQKEAKLREENRLAAIQQQLYVNEFDRTIKMKAVTQQRKDIENLNALKEHIKTKRLEMAQAKAQAKKEEEMLLTSMKEHEKLIHMEAQRMLQSQPPNVLRFISKPFLKSFNQPHTQTKFANISQT